MKKIALLFTIFLSITAEIHCCVCFKKYNRDTTVNNGLKKNNIVFLGQVIDAKENGEFTFQILELYKGPIKSNYIKGSSFGSAGCSAFPKYGLWLVYSNFVKDSTINVSTCDPSFSINENYYPFTPFQFSDNVKLMSDSTYNAKRSLKIKDWDYSLEKLREYKRSNEEKLKTKPHFWESKFFQIGLIGMNIILLILLFFKKRK